MTNKEVTLLYGYEARNKLNWCVQNTEGKLSARVKHLQKCLEGWLKEIEGGPENGLDTRGKVVHKQ